MRKLMMVPKGLPLTLCGLILTVSALAAEPPAFPAKPAAPAVYSCPSPRLLVFREIESKGFVAAESGELARNEARMSGLNLVCRYTLYEPIKIKLERRATSCPAAPSVQVVGTLPGTTTTNTGDGCEMASAWCHGPALGYAGLELKSGPTNGFCFYGGGSVELSTTVSAGTCFNGTGEGTAGGHSPSGRFLCW